MSDPAPNPAQPSGLPAERERRPARFDRLLRRLGRLTDSAVQRILSQRDTERAWRPGLDLMPTPRPGHSAPGGGRPTDAQKGAAAGQAPPATPLARDKPATVAASASERHVLGDFEILGRLGQGSMGSVYLARQRSLDRLVALKILPIDLAHDQEFLERFRREARTAASLRDEHVAEAYDVGVVEGYHYIAMEFVDGPDLERDLAQQPGGRYQETEVLRIAKQMGRALALAVELGIVHRDIKPSNILRSSDGTYKLTDLGLAACKEADQRLAFQAGKGKRVTGFGIAVGTPYYIAPEQARGELHVDVRADIYSLGATLYHLATGQLPFPGQNAVQVMAQHLRAELRPPKDVYPSLSKGLSRLIEKMMAKRPEDRHQSPQELLEDIGLVESGGVPVLKRARFGGRGLTAASLLGFAEGRGGNGVSADGERPPGWWELLRAGLFWTCFLLSAAALGLLLAWLILRHQ